ncbi:hypothetical protein [Flavobacterium ginsenosidimutans]|uniref:hypothetical protein n=1 Tax=Flavobacterium ginsenosidimutans TaxID=687844 RepID=UPI003D9695C4
MKSKLPALLFVLSIFLFSCSSDSDTNSEDLDVKYMKAYKTDTPEYPGDYDSFYEYSNGYLTKGKGYNLFSGTFTYDSSGKLISRHVYDQEYTFEYDSKNRLIKQSRTGSPDNITLKYDNNKITITNSYNYESAEHYDQISELYLDNKQRIIKYRNLSPTTDYTFMVQEYLYDDNNNITQITFKENNYNYDDFVVKYVYDNKKNPFYYAFKKLYKSIYYLECRNGISNYKHTGITPNNMTIYGTSTYAHQYDNDGYPVSWHMVYDNNGTVPATADYTVEYY